MSVQVMLDDAELLVAAGQGDASALEGLYDRYGTLAFSLAYRLLRDRQSAEDIVQEAFLALWHYAARYDADRSEPRPWLMRIVRHRCIDHLRKGMARPQSAGDDGLLDQPGRSDVWEDVLQRLTGHEVRGAMLRLPADQREAIELAYFGGRTHSEIACHLGIPLGTVKGRLRLGLHRLNVLLAPTA